MLIVTRKQAEFLYLFLPDGRQIKILHMGSNRHGEIRLGVDAPPDVRIYRGPELVDENGNLYSRMEGGSNGTKESRPAV